MNRLKKSLEASYLGFKEEPMESFYNHPIVGIPSRLRIKVIMRELGEIKGKLVVDAGCEAGYLSTRLAFKGAKAASFDPCREAIVEFKRKKMLGILGPLVAAAHAIPMKSRCADFIVCTEVLQLTPEIGVMFEEFSRILKEGGRLVVTFPNEGMKKRFYPIAKLLGVSTEAQHEITLYWYSAEEVKRAASQYLEVTRSFRIPSRILPLTEVIVCSK